MRLTRCGELLLPQAQAILRQFIESLLAGVKGRLTIGSIPTVMPYLVAKGASSFLIEYPDVDLQLIENTTPRVIDGLQAGDLGLAILSRPVTSPDMVCSELFRELILLAVPPQHRLASMERVDLKELRQERLLLLQEGPVSEITRWRHAVKPGLRRMPFLKATNSRASSPWWRRAPGSA